MLNKAFVQLSCKRLQTENRQSNALYLASKVSLGEYMSMLDESLAMHQQAVRSLATDTQVIGVRWAG